MNFNLPLILGSESPRRKELLAQLGYSFKTLSSDIDETFSHNIPVEKIAEELALKKYKHLRANDELTDSVILTADTVVISGGLVLNKPSTFELAVDMIQELSSSTHQVITGVCIGGAEKIISFSDQTLVTFGELTREEIEYYINKFSPFDKAGGYGIQEWIGMIGIEKIEGSFYTVMGLPVHLIYKELKNW